MKKSPYGSNSALKFYFVALIICALFSPAFSQAQDMPSITKVEVKGLKRIEEGAVKSRISQKHGDVLSQEKTSDDIKSIFKMGYFDDVKVEIEPLEGGVSLIYVVREKPTVIRVEFQGNKEFDDEKLKEKIALTPGSIADTVLIQDNASKLRSFYEEEGFWYANIVPVIRRLTDDEMTLTYQIVEGDKVKIKKVAIIGCKGLSESKIKKAMETKEWGMFSFMDSSGYYKKDVVEADIEKIRNLYLNEGYLKVLVADPEVSVDRELQGMKVTFRVSEGDQYRISAVDISGNKTYDSETVKKKITMKPGDIFSRKQMEKDIQAVTSLYSDNGYALAMVAPDLTPDDKTAKVQVYFSISEGDKYKIGRIEIAGNIKTKDKVIRREVRLDEGDVFDSSKLKRSYERINNLNYFETVEMIPKPKFEDKTVDLDIRVKERPTGSFSVGGGYSSVDKFIASVDVTQGNLFGNGQYLKLKGEFSGSGSSYELSFRDPWFMDKQLSFSTGIYKTKHKYVDYYKKATGLYTTFGKNLSEFWKTDVTYKLERAEITDISDDASVIIWDQEGVKITSSITPRIVRDTRDNYLDPSTGSRQEADFTFAGIGGTNKFVKTSLDSAWYFPLGPTTFMFRGRFGIGRGIFGEELPLYERFYVGGLYTVRGLGFGDAGPKDSESGDAIGGTEELIFNTEFIFPVLPELRFKGLIFFDAGNAYEDFHDFGKLRYTVGLGIRWISPIGPIRLEWGYNVKPQEDESASRFEFAFGSFF